MPPSRAIVVLGMHRNGTSLLTRGLQSMGIYLGDNFLDTRPDNPTGYWENKPIVAIHERLLKIFGLTWDSVSLITEEQWRAPEVQALRLEAGDYIRSNFTDRPVWGFKDPRTIRLLPFWSPIFSAQNVNDNYVVVIRNPMSVSASLHRRQRISPLKSRLLWLVHMVPYLSRIARRPFVVIDYDLLMDDAPGQLERIAHRLEIPATEATRSDIWNFSNHFLDLTLRHSLSGEDAFDKISHGSSLIREAYRWFHLLATDRMDPDQTGLWLALEEIRLSTELLITSISTDEHNAASQLCS